MSSAAVGFASVPRTDHPYARYASPALCVESARRMSAFFWRDKHPDTARYAPQTDSAPRFVRDSLRLCAAQFSVAKVVDADVMPLLQVALLTGDDATIAAATKRLEAGLPVLPVDRRAWVLEGLATSFLSAMPAQLQRARMYAHALDAMGSAAAYERLSIHKILGTYAHSIGNIALADTETSASLAAMTDLSHTQQITLADTIMSAYFARASAVSLLRGKNAVLALLDSGLNVVVPLTQDGGPMTDYHRAVVQNAFGFYRRLYGAMGTPAKPVHADQWLSTTGDTVFPKSGRVTLAILAHPAFFPVAAISVLRRLHDEYAARGLDIVFMTYTTGWFRTIIEPKPGDEIHNLQRWYLDYWHMPASIAAEESQFGRLADGRRRNVPATNLTNYGFGVSAVLIGKDNVIQFALDIIPANEQVYRQQIDAALAKE